VDIKVVHAINASTVRNATVAVRHGELLVTLHQSAGRGNDNPGQDSSEDSADIKHFDLRGADGGRKGLGFLAGCGWLREQDDCYEMRIESGLLIYCSRLLLGSSPAVMDGY
jgi:hypothetical protein